MSRPATLKVGNTSYWTIMTYTSAGVLVDADSNPTVVVYKNGTLTADVVTVTKRSATTGIYDAYYNPAAEAEGDCFTIQETATISSQAYVQSWNFEILAAERGTDNASTFDAAADTVLNVTNVSVCASNTDMRGTDGANTVAPLDASATENAVWDAIVTNHTTNGSFGDSLLVAQGSEREVQVDSNHSVHAALHTCEPNVIDSSALAASAVTEIQTGLITTGTAFTHTNQAGDTMTVTIT